MVAPAAGSVVLVRFPFSDLTATKLRPAVVLAATGRDDFILCQVTSNPYADPTAIQLTDAELATGSLQRVSYARPGKLFTGSGSIVSWIAGRLTPEALERVTESTVRILRSGLDETVR